MTKEIIIDGYTWYVKRIDYTHFYLSNTKDVFSGMGVYHIEQIRSNDYYEEVRSFIQDN